MIQRLLCKLMGHPSWLLVAWVERVGGRRMAIVRCSACSEQTELSQWHYLSLMEAEE